MAAKRWRVAGIVGVLLVLLTSQRGGVGSFCPFTLRTRSQSERTIRFLHLPFYRSGYTYSEPKLISELTARGLISAVERPLDGHWVSQFHWNDAWRGGYGSLGRWFTRDRHAVLEWCDSKPDCARVYLAEVFKALRSNAKRDVSFGEALLPLFRTLQDLESPEAVREQIENWRLNAS